MGTRGCFDLIRMQIVDLALEIEPFSPAASSEGRFLGAFVGSVLPETLTLDLRFSVVWEAKDANAMHTIAIDIIQGENTLKRHSQAVRKSEGLGRSTHVMSLQVRVPQFGRCFVVIDCGGEGMIGRFSLLDPFTPLAEAA